jgi:hypothetical protein
LAVALFASKQRAADRIAAISFAPAWFGMCIPSQQPGSFGGKMASRSQSAPKRFSGVVD